METSETEHRVISAGALVTQFIRPRKLEYKMGQARIIQMYWVPRQPSPYEFTKAKVQKQRTAVRAGAQAGFDKFGGVRSA